MMDGIRRAPGVECRATKTKTSKPTIGTKTAPSDALSLAKDVRTYLESESNLDGEEHSREVVIAPVSGEKIEARARGAANGESTSATTEKEIVIEIEYETDESAMGIAADESYFLCPGASRRPACWFPCVERGDVLTTFDFSVSAPRDLQVITSAHWDRVERCDDGLPLPGSGSRATVVLEFALWLTPPTGL